MHHTIRLVSYSVLLILILSSLIYAINSNKQETLSEKSISENTSLIESKAVLLTLGESHMIRGVRFTFQQMNTPTDCTQPSCSQKNNTDAIVAIIVGGTTEILHISGNEPTVYANFALELVDTKRTENSVDNIALSIKEVQ